MFRAGSPLGNAAMTMLAADFGELAAMRVSATAVFAGLSLLALQGCIARTVVGVVTAPVRIAGKAVDLATTSQSEADEKRGRALRQRDERLGRLENAHRRHARHCAEGDAAACARAEGALTEIDRIELTAD